MNAETFLREFDKQGEEKNREIVQPVMKILGEVKKNKDQALFDYTEEFDEQKLDCLKVPEQYLKESFEKLDEGVKEALYVARDRIRSYENKIKHENKDIGEFTYVYRPLERVGIYVPGGRALYPSSVLMTVIPAQVAGVKEIHVTTPTFDKHNITFATLYLLGITDVYTVGGAQAVAALAYGTETIPKVDKIAGPGNAYVAMAKRLVFGDVGIDSIAGPSEILLYVDDTADIEAVTYDIYAQAEHDPHARTFLLSESQELLAEIEDSVAVLLEQQERKEIIQASLANNHYAIVDSRENLLAVLNNIAPEHVSIQHKEQDEIVEAINYAGAVFKGAYSPEAIGDYVAGPSHVLPTGGTARYSHGLNVNDFMTSHAVIALEKETFEEIAPAGEIIAEAEELYAHKASLTIRKEEK